MANILFSHSYYLRFDPKQWETMKPYPPLATIYAASAMRELGHAVDLFDVMFVKTPEGVEKQLRDNDPDYLVIYDDSFNWLTKMCLTNMRHACWEMCKLAKKYNCKVIVSSSDASDHYEKYLDNGADFVIVGEGDLTLQELIEKLEEGAADYATIAGIAYKDKGEILKSDKRPLLRDLDSLSNPAWDLVKIDEYRKYWKDAHGYFSLNMATTRGCPYKCNWCAKPIFGRRYHSRSPLSVVNELEQYVSEFKVDHVWFCDDIFGLKPQWVQDFAARVQEKDLVFRYMIQSRVDLILKENTAECLAASGCDVVWLGAESGSQKILDAMDKEIQVDQIYAARKRLGEAGVRCAFFLQFGYLGENKEDIEATLKMVSDLVPDEIGVSVSYPLPGTTFYETVKNQLGDKTNWTDSDDLDLMFENTYSSSFYRVLQRYIHKHLQQKRSVEALKSGQIKNAVRLPYYVLASAYLKQKINKTLN